MYIHFSRKVKVVQGYLRLFIKTKQVIRGYLKCQRGLVTTMTPTGHYILWRVLSLIAFSQRAISVVTNHAQTFKEYMYSPAVYYPCSQSILTIFDFGASWPEVGIPEVSGIPERFPVSPTGFLDVVSGVAELISRRIATIRGWPNNISLLDTSGTGPEDHVLGGHSLEATSRHTRPPHQKHKLPVSATIDNNGQQQMGQP